MNDPTYISSAAPPPPIAQLHPDPTQQDLQDEQLARRLALEEEQAAGAWSADRQSGRDPPVPPTSSRPDTHLRTPSPPLYEDTASPIIPTPTGADPEVQYSGDSCCSNPRNGTSLSLRRHDHRTDVIVSATDAEISPIVEFDSTIVMNGQY